MLQIGVSRENERRYLRLHNQKGVGILMIASFNNGILAQYINGKSLDDESFRQHVTTIDFAKYINDFKLSDIK